MNISNVIALISIVLLQNICCMEQSSIIKDSVIWKIQKDDMTNMDYAIFYDSEGTGIRSQVYNKQSDSHTTLNNQLEHQRFITDAAYFAIDTQDNQCHFYTYNGQIIKDPCFQYSKEFLLNDEDTIQKLESKLDPHALPIQAHRAEILYTDARSARTLQYFDQHGHELDKYTYRAPKSIDVIKTFSIHRLRTEYDQTQINPHRKIDYTTLQKVIEYKYLLYLNIPYKAYILKYNNGIASPIATTPMRIAVQCSKIVTLFGLLYWMQNKVSNLFFFLAL
jgi:hypothetical protein